MTEREEELQAALRRIDNKVADFAASMRIQLAEFASEVSLEVRKAFAPHCGECGVEQYGQATNHKKECPHNWPSVRPSEWTEEQRRRARPWAHQSATPGVSNDDQF